MKRVIKAIGNVLYVLLMVVLVVIIGSGVYVGYQRAVNGVELPLVAGYGVAVVETGSMSPEILPQDVIIVHSEDDYEIGDVVAYETGSIPVTHRIIEEVDGGYITQGDANNTPDQNTVVYDAVIGKVVYVIPQLGNVLAFLGTSTGMFVCIATVIVVIVLPGALKALFIKDGDSDETKE